MPSTDIAKQLMAGFDWRNPDYPAIIRKRIDIMHGLRKNKAAIVGIKEHFKDYPCDFITLMGSTFDPRLVERKIDPVIPFLLFPRQEEFIDWIVARWKGQEDGVAEKSRDMGVSWLTVAAAVWMFLYYPGSVVGFGSRKEEYVDKIGDPKSLFWKVRAFISLLPHEFRPAGWNPAKHAPFMAIQNPENGASIIGEAGDNIGRGNRTSIYFKDESAFYEHAEAIDAALSQTSNCKIDVSTPNGSGNPFYRKAKGGKLSLFVFDWKAQPLDAKLVTPSGYKLMGDIKVGDKVVGSDGKPTHVVAITPHGTKDVYRVTFDDGASTECCDDHLWSVIAAGNQRAERRHILNTMPLRDIAKSYSLVDVRGYKRNLYQVPMTKPVEFDSDAELPLDPYVLGCILGDGSISSNPTGPHLLTVGDSEIADLCAVRLPDGCSMKHDRGIHYRFSAGVSYRGGAEGRGTHSPISAAIRNLGLVGAVSHTKFIPSIYKTSSVENRLDLLCGLFDTDGSVPKSHPGAAKYSTTSKQLADDVAFVVHSLGGTVNMTVANQKKTAEFPGGRVCNRRAENYILSVKLPVGMVPFKLTRKFESFKPATMRPPRRGIVDIQLVGQKEVQCITVSNDNGLYLTDDFVVTHNCDPRKDQAWYDAQVKKADNPAIVAQEIDRNYEASVTNAFISGELVTAAQQRGPTNVQAIGRLRVGVDPARFGDDKFSVTIRRGRLVLLQREAQNLDSFTGAAFVKDCIAPYGEKPEQIAVDEIGIGAGVVDVLARMPEYAGIVVGVNVANRMDGATATEVTSIVPEGSIATTCYNLRAWMYYELREWLQVGSIPADNELKSELTAVRYSYRGGSLLLESKDDMKKRGIKSPNRADSLALTFARPGSTETLTGHDIFHNQAMQTGRRPASRAGY